MRISWAVSWIKIDWISRGRCFQPPLSPILTMVKNKSEWKGLDAGGQKQKYRGPWNWKYTSRTIYNISIISFHVGVVCISIMWQFWDRDIKTSSETCVGAKVIIGIRDACSTADISNGCSSGLLVVTKWSTSGHHVGTKWSPSCKWSPNGLLVVTSYSANGCWVDEFRKKNNISPILLFDWSSMHCRFPQIHIFYLYKFVLMQARVAVRLGIM